MKVSIANELMAELSGIERRRRIGGSLGYRLPGVRVAIHRFQAIVLLLSACAVLEAQTASPPQTQTPSSPAASASPSPERSVSWLQLGPNVLHDQKEIWLFPVSVAHGHHLKPVLILTGITAALVVGVDNPSGRYFQHTQAFSGFNNVFSGKNTSIAMFAVPSAFYGIGLL